MGLSPFLEFDFSTREAHVPFNRFLRRIFAPLIALTSFFAVLIAIAPAAQAQPESQAQSVCFPFSCFGGAVNVTVNITISPPSLQGVQEMLKPPV